MWTLIKEGGLYAFFAAFVGGLAFLTGLASLGALVKSRKIAWGAGIGTLVLGGLVVFLGIYGMYAGRATVEAALLAVDPAKVGPIRQAGYLEAQSCAKIGALFSIAPVLLGGLGALLGGRPKADSRTAFAGSAPAGVAIGVLAVVLVGALACGVLSILPA